ncbi:MAG: ATP-binding protein [Planctomycetes bacterium]|nr:ATP-binding protein [Planctomycetota bacterium]
MESKNTTCSASAKLSVPASPAWYGTIRNLAIQLCRNCGVDDRDSGSIALVLDEAVSNIHRHGYQGSHDEMIDLEIKGIKATPEQPWKITICIKDRAMQIELDKIKSRDLEDVRPGGLGVHLIKSIMDTAIWSHRKNGGMQLFMEKQGEPTTNVADVEKESKLL